MMIDPTRLAFDVDGVIADTMTLFIDIASDHYHISGFSVSDITTYDLTQCIGLSAEIVDSIIGRILSGDHKADLKPMDQAVAVLNRIRRKAAPLLMVTARPVIGPLGDWFEKTFGFSEQDIEIIAAGSFAAKTDILIEHRKTVFVEDRLETCFELNQAGITPIVFRQPWNRDPHPFTEVGSWLEIAALVNI